MCQKFIKSYYEKENKLDPSKVWDHMSSLDPAEMQVIASTLEGLEPSDEQLSAFDYAKAPMRRNSYWVMQLIPMWFQGEDPKERRDEYFPGSTPVYDISINDDQYTFVIRETCPKGEPSSDSLLKYLKRAIASPLPPKTPAIPNVLWLHRDLSPHVDALCPFLDSLPVPFSWRMQQPDEGGDASAYRGVDMSSIARSIRRAEEKKRLGNAAFGRQDSTAAIDHYSGAYEILADTVPRDPTDEEKPAIRRSLAVCLANRAAVWLMAGDAGAALQDAKDATDFDSDYGKAYYRQAKAYSQLDAREKSINVLIKALKRPKLASDEGLIDALVDVYGGLPESPNELRSFCRRLFIDRNGDRRARKVPGFVRRVDAHVERILGSEFCATAV
ncbi:uncharacterized protein C8Q71DRAFT_714832 [Rhodofomes roseus]|uniref:Tetratricopeptide repeat protein n=1 Tax=Rhodofomes roseus TaxID=34475 RepID=A0ABQ8K4E0_9APHY|nr:uncharacterized protein C8Q71DRAFT_714832 [Rhodofomes roseus]KAH9831784.1 hypothetical protein C8Q71DRAFT_714832 [Rhodofomes roseus]